MSTLSYVSPDALKGWLMESPNEISIIDVRDYDYEGERIPGSVRIPSDTFLASVDQHVDDLMKKRSLIVHCTYSQVRGPKAARVLSEILRNRITESKEKLSLSQKEKLFQNLPTVYILHGGFSAWKRRYGGQQGLIEYD
ncbi:Cdc25 family phosphatase Ibp1, unknown role, implicated in DNA replication [Schizosaccharomyces pombe]|uniref:Dual specificity phosphatase ibp1 n=1 Tax=Schizosaccharomyces pombe (strain 972 / ATCC 24843) TaxID=284812 RepID=IBP1_SCHPO|nr:Cdc25 family phosphatase Ibp1 [Schizosaccharomyces pombe]Q8WZK3.1 RecName: Full=Dual specificity phosphatase ibp1; AltName: Full=Cdc25-like phosphatase ibp1; AltName: Full=Itsy bitsy phosphatase 1 [Schizosaccharomyces pombe 972h-]CAB46700.1 Cdc25 family phosphatase Ibp1 [Schizosaccharomyces pombe]|eukprot:NP_595247.1 Cdc25 family phosphatase Ibp1 [Schizosaccharomyces pombe]